MFVTALPTDTMLVMNSVTALLTDNMLGMNSVPLKLNYWFPIHQTAVFKALISFKCS